MGEEESPVPEKDSPPSRRSFLTSASYLAMAGGLTAGYGGFGAVAARYLYPARNQKLSWLFVASVSKWTKGKAMPFRAPSGATIAIARQGMSGEASDFIALSDVCPHLGCRVHWEGQNDRFFCPCHNGVFDKSGKGTGGPPGDAKQSLARYPLKIEKDLLYIGVPEGEQLAERAPRTDPLDANDPEQTEEGNLWA